MNYKLKTANSFKILGTQNEDINYLYLQISSKQQRNEACCDFDDI